LLWQGQVDAAICLLIAPPNKLRILSTTSTSTTGHRQLPVLPGRTDLFDVWGGKNQPSNNRRTKISGAQWNKNVLKYRLTVDNYL